MFVKLQLFVYLKLKTNKMLKKFRTGFLIMFFFAIKANVIAQSFNVTWGDKSRLNKTFDDAVKVDGGKSIVLKKEFSGGGMFSSVKTKISFLLIDANSESLLEKEYEVEEKNTYYKGLEKYGNSVFFTYQVYDKETKLTTLYADKLDQKTLKTIEKINIGSYESDSKSDQAVIKLQLSQDSSKILLLVEAPERKKENRKFYFSVLNTELKKIWSKEVELPFTQKYIYLIKSSISDEGKVYVSVKNYDKEVSKESVKENGSKVPSYVYKILVYSQNAKDKEIILSMGENFVHQSILSFNKNSGIVSIGGLYKQKVNGKINGVFYASLDAKTDVISNQKLIPFDTEILTKIDKDGFASDKDKDPGLDKYYEIVHVAKRPNGSIDIISEYRYFSETWVQPQRGSSYYVYRYQYGTIINTNIDKQGKAIFTRVPKNQKFLIRDMTFDAFLGFFPFIYKDNLVLLFNDDKDNIERDLEKKPDDIMKYKNSVLAAATIDVKGGLTRQAVLSNDDEDYICLPSRFSKIDADNILIVSDLFKVFKKRTRYGILKIK
jgi:hypothetical protein